MVTIFPSGGIIFPHDGTIYPSPSFSLSFPIKFDFRQVCKRYLFVFLHPISEVSDLWQHPEK
mgnify:CR=1 FL=1